MKSYILAGTLLSTTRPVFVDWGDDIPSQQALQAAQQTLEESQIRQFDGETCTLSNGNVINARKLTKNKFSQNINILQKFI